MLRRNGIIGRLIAKDHWVRIVHICASMLPDGGAGIANLPLARDLISRQSSEGMQACKHASTGMQQHFGTYCNRWSTCATVKLTRMQFDMMEGEAMVREMVCVYNRNTKEFHTIVRVGRDVCGYPRTVHGGLTAAIADETFGGALSCSLCKPLRSSSVDSMRAAHSKTSIAYDACLCACLPPPSSLLPWLPSS